MAYESIFSTSFCAAFASYVTVLACILCSAEAKIQKAKTKEAKLEVFPVEEGDEYDFDYMSLPGFGAEFRFRVAAGKKDCFYQHMKDNAELHLQFQVKGE